MLSSLLAIAALAATVHAQTDTLPPGVTGTFPSVPLVSKHFTYPDLPEQVDTQPGLIRGIQSGYNLCNSTTEGPSSLCQTMFMSDIKDFCIWGPPDPNSTIGDEEAVMVAYCTQAGHGTRLIPPGAITGVQFIRTADYISYFIRFDQTTINLQANDSGGELDPHGADLRGNPMGGLVFNNNSFVPNQVIQVSDWLQFVGNNITCAKACNPSSSNQDQYCRNTLDRLGCTYNLPSNAQPGVFEACDGDSGAFPGVYTSNGVTVTYTQPDESLGPITTVPYTPTVPASSNCVTFSSADLFGALPTSSAAASPSIIVSTSNGVVVTATRSGPAGPSNTSSGASSLAISGVSILGVVFAAIFLS